MENLSEIKSEFLVRNQTSTTIGFYTDDILNDWADMAHKYAAGYKKWPFTEGRSSTTFASLVTDEDSLLRGEYPEGWKSDSIRIMRIGGKSVDKKDYAKFRQFLEDNESADDRFFSDRARQYFVNPNIDLSGTVTVWGQYTPASFTGTDTTENTVFLGEQEGNEAIVEMMMSYAKKREKNLGESLAHAKEANRILDELYKRISDEQFEYDSPPDDGMFQRIDVLEGGLRSDVFNRDQFN